jgi:hypothetical protein
VGVIYIYIYKERERERERKREILLSRRTYNLCGSRLRRLFYVTLPPQGVLASEDLGRHWRNAINKLFYQVCVILYPLIL